MKHSRFVQVVLATCLLPAISWLHPQPAAAQSILLVVVESSNGAAVAPPLAVREGLAAELFDAGVIVFDLPAAPARAGAGDLVRIAAAAGADLLLEVSAAYTGPTAGSAATIASRATFVLTDAASGTVQAKGTVEDTNRNRENTVDRSSLGQELGKMVADNILQLLPGGSR